MLTVAVGMTSCKGTRQDSQYQSADSVEFALYASQPIDSPEDCDPVYIPMNLLGVFHEGDTVYINDNNVLQTTFIRDAETGQKMNVHKVRLQGRVEHNIILPIADSY